MASDPMRGIGLSAWICCRLVNRSLPFRTKSPVHSNMAPENPRKRPQADSGVGDYGRSRKYCWIHRDARSIKWDIDKAMRDWVRATHEVGVTTPISYRGTSRKKSSFMDYYVTPKMRGAWAFATHFIGKDVLVRPWEGNDWYYCKVTLGEDLREARNTAYAIISHEAGHCMGLAHTFAPDGIMHGNIAARDTRRASRYELHGINYLYAR